MYTYIPNEDDVFESLKYLEVDESSLEPLLPCAAKGPKLYGTNNGMYGKTHTKASKEKMSHAKQGKVTVKDSQGNVYVVSSDDPRYTSGELVGIAKDKISVKDANGNTFLVDKTDPRYISGELVGVNRGIKFKQRVPSPLKGTFLAKDINGNMCRLTKEDPRYISGEYIHFRKKF